jgi:hypothetical protein
MDNFDLKKYLAEGRIFEEEVETPNPLSLTINPKTLRRVNTDLMVAGAFYRAGAEPGLEWITHQIPKPAKEYFNSEVVKRGWGKIENGKLVWDIIPSDDIE